MADVKTAIGIVLLVSGIVTSAVVIVRMFMDVAGSRKREQLMLEKTLAKLGWERYGDGLWRNKRTGAILTFQDAVARELQITVRMRRIFPGREFKEP